MTHPDRYSHLILDHVADRRYTPGKILDLANNLGIRENELEEFSKTVSRMVDDGQIVLGPLKTVVLPPPGNELTGNFRLNERGFGFLIPDSPIVHGDLFIPAGQTGNALTGDRVRVQVIHDPRRTGGGKAHSPYVGRVVEIVQRSQRHYVGNLQKVGSHWVVDVDGRILRDPVIIHDPHAKNAKAGDKVVVELLEYPHENRPAQGVITEVLGEQGIPDVETSATMHAYGLVDHFPSGVMDDARQAASLFTETHVPHDRENLTNLVIVTIDPPDAKDYDDAIHIRLLDHQPDHAAYELGVHIAHVSHFVRPGSDLDREAYKRGNSSYLPRKVIPMLPELLSNGVCSLQEAVNRFCLSAFIRYDQHGDVVGQRFAKTVVRSSKRLTYLEAQSLIDDDIRQAMKHAVTEPRYPRKIVETLKNMDRLAKRIRQRRLKQGMIVLALPEVELKYDDSGRVIDAVKEDDSFTHTLIEMLMVEANEAAARLFDSLNVPMIRRIHPDPPHYDISQLRQFARVAGFNIPAHPTRKELQTLLDSVRGKPAQQAVHLAVLQTLSSAKYSSLRVGHFALASEHYTHFTSPIRRYPDLIVHRGLDAYLEITSASREPINSSKLAKLLRDDPRCPSEQTLHQLGQHCSSTERNSEAAERDLRKYLVLDLLREHLGEDFDGTATGLTSDGVFIQLDRFLIDGFVRSTDLPSHPSDRWRLNRATGVLVATRSGKTISIGDRFVVRIAKVNPTRRTMELVITNQHGKKTPPQKRTQPPGARKAHQQTMRIKHQRKQNRRQKHH